MYLGVDYYPEHWQHLGEHMADEDMARMQRMGANIIRIGEFSWHLIEPKSGMFDFSFFDNLIEKAKKYDLSILFGTPTATFPAWLAQSEPSVLSKNELAQTRVFGGRRQYCYNSSVYEQYSHRMVKNLVAHYANEPIIMGWQVDNELGHEGSDQCYCEQCHIAFQQFLNEKFSGDISQLNHVYGTVFWGQTYNNFNEIPMPMKTITTHNPSLRLDWARFRSHSINQFAIKQIEQIKRLRGAHQKITHNFFGGFFNVTHNQNVLSEHLDFVSYDNYPVWGGLSEPISPAQIAMTHDYIRGLKQRNFWIVEELMGAQGHNDIGYLPRPKQAQMWAYQAMIRGCDNMLFFRWRGMDRGAEQYCLGILDVDNQDNRKLAEVTEFMHEVVKHQNAFNSEIHAQVAILYDYDNIQSWKIQQQSSAFDFTTELMRFYTVFYDANLMTDVISVDKDFSSYKVLVLPVMQIIDEALVKRLKIFVAAGGVLIVGFRAATKNRDNNLNLLQKTSAFMNDLLGIFISESESLGLGKKASIVSIDGLHYSEVKVWRDMVESTGADVLYRYTEDFYQDKACVTSHSFGDGTAYYVGAGVSTDVLQRVLDEVRTKVSLPVIETCEGVECVIRKGLDNQQTQYLINHTSQTQKTVLGNLAPYSVLFE